MSTFYAVSTGCLSCCNGVANYINVSCRTLGGTARLIGFAEFTSPSTPPRYYRKKAYTGTFFRCNYPTATDCANDTNRQGSDAGLNNNMQCQYDAVTGALVTTGARTTLQDFGTCPASTQISSSSDCTFDFATPGNAQQLFSATQTTISSSAIGQCIALAGLFSKITACDRAEALSDEDFDADATARLIASSNYSAWTPVGDGTGGTCVVSQCCKSNYESRTSNAFTYVQSQYRANIQNANSTSYSLMAELWRAPSGFSNYSLYSYQITPFVTNATGFASVVVGVPITLGYSTYASNVEYF